MSEFVVSSRAEGDIASAFDWYEACCPGLGGRFVLSLDAAFAAVQRNPWGFAVRHAGHRMATIPRFPYGIFFILDESRDQIVVRRILHCHRDVPNAL